MDLVVVLASEVLLIVGAGGHGKDLQVIAERLSLPSWFVDDEPRLECPVPSGVHMYALGVNRPSVRVRLDERFTRRAWCPKELVDPSALVGPGCVIGSGAVVAPNCVLLRDVTVGRHAHLNYGVQATRATVGDYCTVAPGVTICGDVTIGARTFVGAGATICNLVSVGDDVTVGAGAVVTRDVPSGVTVMGVPAK